jgi:hypothetical protein
LDFIILEGSESYAYTIHSFELALAMEYFDGQVFTERGPLRAAPDILPLLKDLTGPRPRPRLALPRPLPLSLFFFIMSSRDISTVAAIEIAEAAQTFLRK